MNTTVPRQRLQKAPCLTAGERTGLTGPPSRFARSWFSAGPRGRQLPAAGSAVTCGPGDWSVRRTKPSWSSPSWSPTRPPSGEVSVWPCGSDKTRTPADAADRGTGHRPRSAPGVPGTASRARCVQRPRTAAGLRPGSPVGQPSHQPGPPGLGRTDAGTRRIDQQAVPERNPLRIVAVAASRRRPGGPRLQPRGPLHGNPDRAIPTGRRHGNPSIARLRYEVRGSPGPHSNAACHHRRGPGRGRR